MVQSSLLELAVCDKKIELLKQNTIGKEAITRYYKDNDRQPSKPL